MLTVHDELLVHQAPTTFDHSVTTDHRFFDRWAVGVQHPDLSLIYGIAAYKNTNVCDGFACVQIGQRQVNLRVTRPLRPDFSLRIDRLQVEVVEPLWVHRLVVRDDGRSPLACDVTWTGSLPAREEHPHFERSDGRAARDYCRFDQLGTATGWVSVDDVRVELANAWAWRDHSWGVRPGMGGADPVRPHPSTDGAAPALGNLFVWLAFEAGDAAGQFQFQQRGDGTLLDIDGHLVPDTRDPGTSLSIAAVDHDIDFVDGDAAFRRARLRVRTGDGRAWLLDNVPLRPPWVFRGAGYSGGWNDGQGLGVPRGHLVEADEYVLVGPADVRLADGTLARPWHRETDVATTLDGVPGNGHLTIIASPPMPTATIAEGAP